ncbi:MAG TPA: type II secretion system F family protein [Isosphaeraceae bacterium]|nr:type II secretion system F family protein [Isosphaeraceae bacterium]
MDPTYLTLLTFGAVVAAVSGAYSIFSDLYLRDRTRVSQRIDDEFRRRQRERARKAMLFKDLNQLVAEASGDLEPKSDLRRWLATMVEQSGEDDLTVRKLLTLSVAAGLVLGVLVGLWRQSPIAAAAAAVIGAALPVLNVHLKRKARLEKLLAQLPDAFDLMGRVVRAGQTLSQALQSVVDEFAQPIAGELAYCYEQQNLGLPPEVAMRDLARRTGLLEIKIFVTAVMVQQQTGGSLAEVLDKLAGVIRQRYRIRGQIKSLTAEGRLQAVILLGLPIVMFCGFMLVMPAYESRLLEHPVLIGLTLGAELLGALWIRKIVNFDF